MVINCGPCGPFRFVAETPKYYLYHYGGAGFTDARVLRVVVGGCCYLGPVGIIHLTYLHPPPYHPPVCRNLTGAAAQIVVCRRRRRRCPYARVFTRKTNPPRNPILAVSIKYASENIMMSSPIVAGNESRLNTKTSPCADKSVYYLVVYDTT